jgi:uncharacterized membrane protein
MPLLAPEHIHPILVNFTAALVPASVGSDILGRLTRRPSLRTAAWWMLLYGTAITPLTALAGLWWKKEAGPMLPPDLLLRHEWLGIGLAVLFLVLAVWRWRIYRKGGWPGIAYLLLGLVAVGALIEQGMLGGAMLFGS